MESSTNLSSGAQRGLELEVLLWAAEPFASKIAKSLTARLGAAVALASDQRVCQELLSAREFTLILLEESVALEHPAAIRSIYEAAGAALVLEVNFGIADRDRVVQQVTAALARRVREEKKARETAMHSLQSELSASVSGLLLESASALRKAGPELAPSLKQVVALSEALSRQLRL